MGTNIREIILGDKLITELWKNTGLRHQIHIGINAQLVEEMVLQVDFLPETHEKLNTRINIKFIVKLLNKLVFNIQTVYTVKRIKVSLRLFIGFKRQEQLTSDQIMIIIKHLANKVDHTHQITLQESNEELDSLRITLIKSKGQTLIQSGGAELSIILEQYSLSNRI